MTWGKPIHCSDQRSVMIWLWKRTTCWSVESRLKRPRVEALGLVRRLCQWNRWVITVMWVRVQILTSVTSGLIWHAFQMWRWKDWDMGYKKEKLWVIPEQVGEWLCHYRERTLRRKEHGGAGSLGVSEANGKTQNCVSGVIYRNLSENQSAWFLRQS